MNSSSNIKITLIATKIKKILVQQLCMSETRILVNIRQNRTLKNTTPMMIMIFTLPQKDSSTLFIVKNVKKLSPVEISCLKYLDQKHEITRVGRVKVHDKPAPKPMAAILGTGSSPIKINDLLNDIIIN